VEKYQAMTKFSLRAALSLVVAFGLAIAAGTAIADVFDMPSGQASLQFVTVGDPGNAPDPATGNLYGAVPYTFQMGKYDVTLAQYCHFLNAVAAVSDPYGLWSSYMATDYPNYWGVNIGISRSGTEGNYAYTVMGTGYDMPVFDVSWGNAARFCNWLQNGQPTGAEGTGTTESGAYTLNGTTSITDPIAVTRNAGATYFIPTENEWYKAAYYKGNGTASGYWTYVTVSNSTPSNVLSATGTNNANYYNDGYTDPTNYLTPVGYFAGSPGPYGTYDMGGDIWQWNEADFYGDGSARGVRGGSFVDNSLDLTSAYPGYVTPTYENFYIGFRVASVPEPGSMTFLVAAVVGLICWRRWR
jgi:formylglycine-generating enzyme